MQKSIVSLITPLKDQNDNIDSDIKDIKCNISSIEKGNASILKGIEKVATDELAKVGENIDARFKSTEIFIENEKCNFNKQLRTLQGKLQNDFQTLDSNYSNKIDSLQLKFEKIQEQIKINNKSCIDSNLLKLEESTNAIIKVDTENRVKEFTKIYSDISQRNDGIETKFNSVIRSVEKSKDDLNKIVESINHDLKKQEAQITTLITSAHGKIENNTIEFIEKMTKETKELLSTNDKMNKSTNEIKEKELKIMLSNNEDKTRNAQKELKENIENINQGIKTYNSDVTMSIGSMSSKIGINITELNNIKTDIGKIQGITDDIYKFQETMREVWMSPERLSEQTIIKDELNSFKNSLVTISVNLNSFIGNPNVDIILKQAAKELSNKEDKVKESSMGAVLKCIYIGAFALAAGVALRSVIPMLGG